MKAAHSRCLEATGTDTKYTFMIESDKALVVPFEIGMGQTGTAGAELGTVLSMTNNGRRDLVDLTDPLPSQSDQADMGGISVYFNMVTATGKIQLTQGVNVIEITKSGGNVDYLNIMTSATLTDKTVPYWCGDHMLEFEVVTAPTKTTRGELKVTCPDEGCTKGERLYDHGSLPELTNDCYTVEDDGYYIELFVQMIKVAELTAEAA